MTKPPISVFSDRAGDVNTDMLDGWEAIEGNPTMQRWREYAADDGSAFCAWWSSTTGTYRVIYRAWELVHLLQGKIIITPDGGEPREVGAGDTFIIENGFIGTWKIEEPALKVCTFIPK